MERIEVGYVGYKIRTENHHDTKEEVVYEIALGTEFAKDYSFYAPAPSQLPEGHDTKKLTHQQLLQAVELLAVRLREGNQGFEKVARH